MVKRMNNLPEEIIEKILYKLPVKSLLRFKCVSKRWCSLISSKYFAQEHLKEKSGTDSDLSHHYLLFSDYINQQSIGSCSLRSIFDERDNRLGPCFLRSFYDDGDGDGDEPNMLGSSYLRPLANDFNPIETFDFDIQIVGSCNGLILISMNWDEKLFIWNPATRQTNRIIAPSLPEQGRLYLPIWDDIILGFGYNESTDDYNVVAILIYFYPHQTQMYSSKTGSWKEIESPDKNIPLEFGSGKFVNGRLHWIVEGDIVHGWDIVSFDLVSEKYEVVAGPECLSVRIHTRPVVKDLGGYLSLIWSSAKFDVHVWVMTKYGVSQSWTRIWKIDDFSDLQGWIPRAMPLCLLKNGDMAVSLGQDVLVCNGRDKLRKSRVHILDSKVDSIIYFESLVSPFGER